MTEDQMEALYREWVDSEAHLCESGHHGNERAAFYAGIAAGRERIAKLAEDRDARYDETASCSCGRTNPGTGKPHTYVTRIGLAFADLIRQEAP